MFTDSAASSGTPISGFYAATSDEQHLFIRNLNLAKNGGSDWRPNFMIHLDSVSAKDHICPLQCVGRHLTACQKRAILLKGQNVASSPDLLPLPNQRLPHIFVRLLTGTATATGHQENRSGNNSAQASRLTPPPFRARVTGEFLHVEGQATQALAAMATRLITQIGLRLRVRL